MTAADQELNLQAQQKVSTLAEAIAQIASSQPNYKPSHEPGAQGEMVVVTVTVPAATEYGSNQAAYNLSFTSPANASGEPQPDKVAFLTMSAGAIGDPNDPPAPNVYLGFQINPATGAWEASAHVSNTLTNSTQRVGVGIDPVSSKVTDMTSDQLDDLFNLGMGIIGDVQHGDNIANFSLPQTFNQTTTPIAAAPGNSNGGTAVPPETLSPSGGTSAP
jgi:hypothetical protein